MATKQVIERPAAGVPAVREELGVSGQFGVDDFVIPTAQLVQPGSAPERGTAGKFCFQDGRQLDRVVAVTLNIIGTRGIKNPYGSADKMFLCHSADRRLGMTSQPELVVGADRAEELGFTAGTETIIPCELCPHYLDRKKQQLAEGDCPDMYTLLLFDTEARLPFLYYVKGTHMWPVKSRIVSPVMTRLDRHEKAEPWRTPFEWKARQVTSKKGNWWVPEITPLPDVNAEDYKFYEEKAMEHSGQAVQQAEQDPDSPEEQRGPQEPDSSEEQPAPEAATAAPDGAKQRPLPRN